jgi:hypothetical protein
MGGCFKPNTLQKGRRGSLTATGSRRAPSPGGPPLRVAGALPQRFTHRGVDRTSSRRSDSRSSTSCPRSNCLQPSAGPPTPEPRRLRSRPNSNCHHGAVPRRCAREPPTRQDSRSTCGQRMSATDMTAGPTSKLVDMPPAVTVAGVSGGQHRPHFLRERACLCTPTCRCAAAFAHARRRWWCVIVGEPSERRTAPNRSHGVWSPR